MPEICFVCETPIVEGVCPCNAPWPCPGCHAMPGEPHAPDCIDEEIRLNREDDDLRYWDWDDGASEKYDDDPGPDDEPDVAHE